MILKERTPLKITNLVQKFCKEIVSDSFPKYVKVEVWEKSQRIDCYNNVKKYCSEFGGEVVYGWMILIWPSVFIEAQFHAVWKDSSGNFLDITDNHGHFDKILFLEDKNRIYEGKQVNNIRKALKNTNLVNNYIRLFDVVFETMNEEELVEKTGLVKISTQKHKTLIEAQKLQVEIENVFINPDKFKGKQCPCRSGKKFKKCCG